MRLFLRADAPPLVRVVPLRIPPRDSNFDRSHPLLRGVIDHLTRKLVVDIPHPAAFFVLPFLDGTGPVRLLELLALAIEAPAHRAEIAPIAKEAGSLASDMSHSRHFDTKINPHDGLPSGWWGILHRQGHISYPLAPFALDAQRPGFSLEGHIGTSNAYLLRFPVSASRRFGHPCAMRQF